MLFANTGWSNLGGHGWNSTTKQLIGELRCELERLVARERAGDLGSINYAMQKDCEEIKREFNDILDKKDVGRDVQSIQNANNCDALMARALALPEDDTTIKIRQDMMDIQRWGGGEHEANLACRKARMECAIAIRQNAPNRQALFDQYKFSYSYQSLKYHLENVTTGRTEELGLLWDTMNDIASGDGTEDQKYTTMRQIMLQYFNQVRQEDNAFGSWSGFFGRVSRLTRAIESFLLIDASEGGLGYTLGEGDNQVHHVEESRLCATFRSCLPR